MPKPTGTDTSPCCIYSVVAEVMTPASALVAWIAACQATPSVASWEASLGNLVRSRRWRSKRMAQAFEDMREALEQWDQFAALGPSPGIPYVCKVHWRRNPWRAWARTH